MLTTKVLIAVNELIAAKELMAVKEITIKIAIVVRDNNKSTNISK